VEGRKVDEEVTTENATKRKQGSWIERRERSGKERESCP
jgi:hypothetical protein